MEPAKEFRTAYATEPVHDLSPLRKYAEDISFITTGYEDVVKIPSAVEQGLRDFDPKVDVIIPVGRVITSMIAGMALARLHPDEVISVGIYKKSNDKTRDYFFVPVRF